MATHSLTYFVATTLDGFIAHPDGSWDGFLGEGDHLQALQEEMADFDTVLMGRRTYEVGLAAGLEPGQPAYPPLRQVVYGRGIELPPGSPIEVISQDSVDHVRALKEAGGALWLCGGSVFAGSLARAGLIDQLVVKLNPVAFGAGLPLFDRLEGQLAWSLEGTRAFESGVVFLRYRRG